MRVESGGVTGQSLGGREASRARGPQAVPIPSARLRPASSDQGPAEASPLLPAASSTC